MSRGTRPGAGELGQGTSPGATGQGQDRGRTGPVTMRRGKGSRGNKAPTIYQARSASGPGNKQGDCLGEQGA